MSVVSIALFDETNLYEQYQSNDPYGEPHQGDSFDLIRIYEIKNSDGSTQYFKHVITLGSYGYAEAGDISPRFAEVKAEQKTITVFE